MANYTIAVEGSNYVARNASNTIVATNSNFITMLTSLNSYVSNGDTISIANGNYTANGKVEWTKTCTFTGASLSAKIINGGYTAGTLFQMSKNGTDIIFDTITWENNSVNSGYPPLQLGCPNGIVRNCSFLNVIQYNMLSYAANNFRIANNYVNKAQYGISTGGDVTTGYDRNGIITGNTLVDCKDDCIKIRWCNSVTVELNDVDVNPTSWATPYNAPCGVGFSSADGPSYNVTVQNNHIHNSHLATNWVLNGVTIRPVGVIAGPDVPANWGSPTPAASSGIIIQGNLIEWMNYGVSITSLVGVTIRNNKFVNCATDILNNGTSTVITGNLHSATASGRRKLTTSCNIATGIKLQGFQLAVNEICYTEQGSTITVSAPTMAGYTLDKIYVNGSGYNPNASGEYSFTVQAMDYTVSASYVTNQTNYTITTNAVGGGTIIAVPSGSSQPSGSVIELTAVPNLHYSFTGWSGDLAGDNNPESVTMTTNKSITATFEADPTPTPHLMRIRIPAMVVDIVVESG
jgi:hypothetical protein